MSRLYPCVYCTEDGYCEKYSDEEVTSWCLQSPCKDEKPSNADRIRAMTDEELAEMMSPNDNGCPPIMRGCTSCLGQTSCEKCWLDWLKQEAEA